MWGRRIRFGVGGGLLGAALGGLACLRVGDIFKSHSQLRRAWNVLQTLHLDGFVLKKWICEQD